MRGLHWYDDGYEYTTPTTKGLNTQKQRLFFFTVWFINADWTEPTSPSPFHTHHNPHKCTTFKSHSRFVSSLSLFTIPVRTSLNWYSNLPQCQGGWEFNATPSMPHHQYPYFVVSCWALPSLKLFGDLVIFRVRLSFISLSLSLSLCFVHEHWTCPTLYGVVNFFSIHRSLSVPSWFSLQLI